MKAWSKQSPILVHKCPTAAAAVYRNLKTENWRPLCTCMLWTAFTNTCHYLAWVNVFTTWILICLLSIQYDRVCNIANLLPFILLQGFESVVIYFTLISFQIIEAELPRTMSGKSVRKVLKNIAQDPSLQGKYLLDASQIKKHCNAFHNIVM